MTKWQTTNYKGEQVTWYSSDVVEKLKKEVKQIGSDFIKKGDYARELEQENEKLKEENFNFEEIVKLCKCEQYQHTLQKIKETAEQFDVDCIYRIAVIKAILTKAEEE